MSVQALPRRWFTRLTPVLDRWLWVVVAALLVLLAAVYAVDVVRYFNAADLLVYHAGGTALRQGIPLYADAFPVLLNTGDLPFTYPPSAAVMFVPLSLLPFGVAKVAHELVNVTAVVAIWLLLLRHRGWHWRRALPGALAAAVASSVLEPVRETLHFGQINLVLMLLVCADCLMRWPSWWRLPRGVLTGVAAAIKLTPAVAVLYFAARRDWRAVACAIGTFVAVTLLGLLIAPGDTWQFWSSTLLHSDRIGEVTFSYNQSMTGELARLGLNGAAREAVWLVAVLGAVTAGYLAARHAVRAGDDLAAVLAAVAVGLIASPISWDHHYVWVMAAVALLVWWRVRWWLTAVVLVLFAAPLHIFWPNTHERHWQWWDHATGNLYLVGAIVLISAVWLRYRAAGAPDPAPVRDRGDRGDLSARTVTTAPATSGTSR